MHRMKYETEHLALEPIGPQHAHDLWVLHQDPVVADWYGGAWSEAQAETFAKQCGWAWEHDGVCKWIARARTDGRLVGRGGLSRLPVDSAAAIQIDALFSDDEWMRDRLELGWALLSEYQGRGLATEIGREGLRFAFEDLDAAAVIAYTERCNAASRAVMERLDLRLRGEIEAFGLVDGPGDLHDDAPFVVYSTTRAR